MIRRAMALLAVLIAAAACSHLRPAAGPTAARRDFLAGVAAHRRGADDAAALAWERCLKEAAPGGQDEQDCRVSSDLLRELDAAKAAPGASVPSAAVQAPAPPRTRSARPAAPVDALRRAEQSYLEGVVFYQNADWEKSRAAWKKCFLAVPAGSEVSADCRAGLAKLGEEPPSPPAASPDAERRAQQAYLEGVVYYQKGDDIKAAGAWKKCIDLLEPGAAGAADCRTGLERLESSGGRPARN